MTPSGNKDWDKELAKIDRQLASMSDDQLLASTKQAPPAAGGTAVPAVAPAAPAAPAAPTRAGVIARIGLALVLGVGVLFWPYGAACGPGLVAYLGAAASVMAAGVWAATATWRARAGQGHVIALLVLAWGLALTAIEVLPRLGYATDPARTAWLCR
jgi:hypothetical protein